MSDNVVQVCDVSIFLALEEQKCNLKHLTSKLFSVSSEEARETFCYAEISRGTEKFFRKILRTEEAKVILESKTAKVSKAAFF